MKMFNENVRRCVAFHADHPRIRQILGHRQSNFTFDFQNVQPEQTMAVIKKLNIKKTIMMPIQQNSFGIVMYS